MLKHLTPTGARTARGTEAIARLAVPPWKVEKVRAGLAANEDEAKEKTASVAVFSI